MNNEIIQQKVRANALRILSADMVERAKSGHPGAPLGMADFIEVLWNEFLLIDPVHPDWINRDRFVLSNGHASALLYSLLHLSGYSLTLEDLKQFRQINSKTPGHPEYGLTPGVETTTGPLGQGIAMAVGMALAERTLAAKFNKVNLSIINHRTYCVVGDGDLMEGISHEACSLAGTLGLGKLVVLYDDNDISIDGAVAQWMNEDVGARFLAYGWQVIGPIDGHNPKEVSAAIKKSHQDKDSPSLIITKTVIGYGAPSKSGNKNIHGSPLGEEELSGLRIALNWNHAPFSIPVSIKEQWDKTLSGKNIYMEWSQLLTQYQTSYPDLYNELLRRMKGILPDEYHEAYSKSLADTHQEAKSTATRHSARSALDSLAPHLPELFGGSADLTSSNQTSLSNSVPVHESPSGNYLHYGVREFAMCAIQSGLRLHGCFIPYGGTFLTFSDYARNAIRLASMMKLKTIYVFTHDSIGLGEDGPTHQPVEHLWSLRLIPNLKVWRPSDSLEALVAYHASLCNNGPSVLALSRQNCDYNQQIEADPHQLSEKIMKGGYLLRDDPNPQLQIIATGSEVTIAMALRTSLAKQQITCQVVSMPCYEQFIAQDDTYKKIVLPPTIGKKVLLEAGVTLPWKNLLGDKALLCGVDSYGESAPYADCYYHFSLDHDSLLRKIVNYIKN